ncbi:nitroreductase family protein [Thiomicrorhabdus sediminis]|uniref:Nitroreductase n=1 Tax=Thiomicrorhabdus sediminis TaxID=2580412 RepID=A0A4V1HHI6_9GAMM|nr:nitroreductase [Thiomicrorhabdus sediminis]QCU89153.1 nitroreductase [Thiomicrorhabdus sediminis]
MTSSAIHSEQLLKFILSRRTCYQFIDKALDKEQLNQCIQAAISAPNHKLTQPWFFYIVGDQTAQSLSHIYADNRAKKKAGDDLDCYQIMYDKAIAKYNAIPQVVLITQNLADDEVTRQEDYAACSCAIQNMQLMAWSLNIGMQWSTGPIINDERTYQLLSIDSSKQQIIGAIYMGYTELDCQAKNPLKRKSVDQVSRYLK